MSGGEYDRRVRLAIAKGTIPQDVSGDITVQHDSDCPAIHGGPTCQCDPIITYRARGRPSLRILADGTGSVIQ